MRRAKTKVTWDKTDLTETYNSLEEKKAAVLKESLEGTWATASKNFWKDYPIELIEQLAKNYLTTSYEIRHWESVYDYSILRDVLKLKTIEEFGKTINYPFIVK